MHGRAQRLWSFPVEGMQDRRTTSRTRLPSVRGAGIHAYVLQYRVAPHRHPAPLEDGKEALLAIREGALGLAVDNTRVGVLGFSAGGHLAATLSTAVGSGNARLDVEAARPGLTILCYPVVSFTDAVHQGSVDNLGGGSPADDLLPALSYAGALVRAGVPAELHVSPQGRLEPSAVTEASGSPGHRP